MVPCFVGIIFELVFVIPFTTPLDKSGSIFLAEAWAYGIFLSGIWVRLVFLFGIEPWKTEFEAIKQNGFTNVQGLRILKNVIYPAVYRLLTFLLLPYVLVKGLLFRIIGEWIF